MFWNETRCWVELKVVPVLGLHDVPWRSAGLGKSNEIMERRQSRQLLACRLRQWPASVSHERKVRNSFQRGGSAHLLQDGRGVETTHNPGCLVYRTGNGGGERSISGSKDYYGVEENGYEERKPNAGRLFNSCQYQIQQDMIWLLLTW